MGLFLPDVDVGEVESAMDKKRRACNRQRQGTLNVFKSIAAVCFTVSCHGGADGQARGRSRCPVGGACS